MKESTAQKYSDIGLTRDKLEQLFCIESYSMPEIGTMYNISSSVVYGLIHYYNIVRTPEQELLYKQKMSKVYSASGKSLETQQKRKKTMIQHYGVEHWAKSDEGRSTLSEIQHRPEVIEKIKQTSLERYGSTSYFTSAEFESRKEELQAKKIESTRQKYGADYWVQSDAGKMFLKTNSDKHNKQVAETCLLRYGTVNPNQLDTIKTKIKDTKKLRYGEDYNHIFVDKIKATKLERYGDETYNNLEKSQATKLERYGDPNYCNPQKIVQKFIDLQPEEFRPYYRNRDASIELLTNHSYTAYDLVHKFNVTYAVIYGWIKYLDLSSYIISEKSHYESELRSVFGQCGFTKTNDRTVLDSKHELDLYNPDKKIGIEFNGDYWHSSYQKSKNYHQEKSLLAESKGIRLIHIYEYEWNDPRIRPIIESLVMISTGNVSTRIYARDCSIRNITNTEAKEFNNQNHLQGHRNASVTYGLFYNDTLVQLMSFSKHPKYQWEIIRGCPGSNNIVVGGVSKLFTHFVREYNPDTVFSYCDFNKFDGKGYQSLGMEFIGYTGPDKTWLINGKAVKRNPHRYKEYKESSEAIIWGAGSKKYLWKNQNIDKIACIYN